jgi:hypothetical protein
MIITLKRPVTVGDGEAKKTIDSVSLDGLDALTGADILFCRREATAKTGLPIFYGALDDAYRLEIAAKVSGVGVDTLLKLWAPDFEEVDATVKSFLMGLDSA